MNAVPQRHMTPAEYLERSAEEHVTLHTERWGEGNAFPVLLVHGWMGSSELYRDFGPVLSERGFDVVATDLRGHGRSPKPEGEYLPELFSEDLRGLVESLGWQDGFALLGQSMGGFVVLDYALRHPETLSHLIVCNTSVNLRATFLSRFVWRLNMGIYRWSPRTLVRLGVPRFFHQPPTEEVVARLTEMSLRTPKHAGLSAIRNVWRRNLEPELGRVAVPTLVVTSEFDAPDLREATLRIHRCIADSRLVDLSGCGHLPFVEAPAPTAAAIAEFLHDG